MVECLLPKQKIAGSIPVSRSTLKFGIGRATYYRWRKENQEFAKLADEAILEGSLLINDLAESQLMSAIRDKNMTAIIFWLKNHHASYATKDGSLSAHFEHTVAVIEGGGRGIDKV